jgi:hypothetical protein
MAKTVPRIEEDEYWRWVAIQQAIKDLLGPRGRGGQ